MNDRGNAVIEFALVVPLLLLVVVAIGELVGTGRAQLEVVHAAREGARVAATVPDPARAVDAARSALSPAMADVATVHVVRPHVVGQPAAVSVRAPRTVAPGIFGGFDVEVSATATMRVEQ